jgi:hypothetical protein
MAGSSEDSLIGRSETADALRRWLLDLGFASSNCDWLACEFCIATAPYGLSGREPARFEIWTWTHGFVAVRSAVDTPRGVLTVTSLLPLDPGTGGEWRVASGQWPTAG